MASQEVRFARIALNRLGLIAKSRERDRRPIQDEIDAIIHAADMNLRQIIPAGRIVKFAIATAMRQDEICRDLFEDFNARQATLCIRQRKHLRQKTTNDQVIPLVSDAGYDPMVLIEQQAERLGRTTASFFPMMAGPSVLRSGGYVVISLSMTCALADQGGRPV